MSAAATWPASLWQRFALAIERARPGMALGPWFTVNAVLELRGPLRVAALAAALDDLVRRHDVLRTRLDLDGPEPRQVVTPRVTGLLETVDEPGVLAAGGWLHAPVAPDGPAPLRARLARRSGEEHVLSLHLHHLMADPVSLWTALADLAALYGAALGGPAPPPPAGQYGQYALAEAEQVRAGRPAAERWWAGAVGDARFAPVRPGGSAPFAYRATLLAPAEAAAVERLSRAHRATTFVTLLAGLACAMGPHLGDGDSLVFDTLFGKRDRPEWQRMLGPCIAPCYLALPRPPARLDGGYLRAVRDRVLGCQRHVRFPVADVDAMNGFLADPTRIVPFFEYLPQRWPADLAFGPATGRVVAAAGPRDTGLAGALGIRVRQDADGAVRGHLSGDGAGWTDARTDAVTRALPDQIRGALPPAGQPGDRRPAGEPTARR